MHIHTLTKWQHKHCFHIAQGHGERNTWRVIWLTFAVMIVEIVAGLAFGSMALLADGWHMGTHVAALGITVVAYAYARRHTDDPRYTFGTGKVSVLGGFASAIALAVVAMLMAVESIQRLFASGEIQFDEAIVVAVLGLVVNLACAYLLRGHEHHDHEHGDHIHSSGKVHQHDHNLRAAYLHVVADAMTSLLAIVALLAGKALGWVWLDPVMGIVGAIVITRWSFGLLRDTSKILLDSSVDCDTVSAIRSAIELDADNRVSDLHVWRVGSRHLAAVLSVVTHFPKRPEHYKELLAEFDVVHVTVEVNPCGGDPCLAL
ncbi:MAG: CDF family Co(II)/Ni(II) efflux transporter DmeF [Anaerolineae bacterium]|jgi:cation diffusion facilitator family transporter